MLFSKSQYSVNNETYVFKRTEANGKITGSFIAPQFGILPFKAIYLEYRAGQEAPRVSGVCACTRNGSPARTWPQQAIQCPHRPFHAAMAIVPG